MRDLTLTEIERLRAEDADAAVPLEMDEESFRGFYDRTARTLRAYLARVTGDAALADDLLQEAYYRFLRARGDYEGEAHRRNALFRIATNLIYDSRRRARVAPFLDTSQQEIADRHDEAAATERATDLRRAMARLKPRERALLVARLRPGVVAQGNRRVARAACRQRQAAAVSRAAPAGRAADRHARRRTGKDPIVKLQCPFEQELLDAVAARRWPDRAEPALRAHVASCSLCSDVAEIAGAFFEDRDCARAEAVVPPRAPSGGERRFAPAKKPPGWRSARCWSSRSSPRSAPPSAPSPSPRRLAGHPRRAGGDCRHRVADTAEQRQLLVAPRRGVLHDTATDCCRNVGGCSAGRGLSGAR